MSVSVDERKAAMAIAHSVERLERIGIYAATVIGRRAHRSAVAAYRRGRDPTAVVRATIATMAPLLVDAMIAGYLNGIWRLFLLARLQKKSLAISFTSSVFRQELRVLVRRTSLPPLKLASVEKQYGSVVRMVTTNISDDVNRKLRAAIAESKRLGEHVKEGVARLSKACENAGVGHLKSHQLEAVFRTQTMLANNAGAWAADQNPEIQEILWGYKYISVGDDRVRPEHAAMDGITLPKDHPFWNENFPSNGWNCRCQALQLFEPETIVRPPTDYRDLDGNLVKPQADEGFRFHSGRAFQSVGGIPGKVPAGKLPLPKIKAPKPSQATKAAAAVALQKLLTTTSPKPLPPPAAKEAVIAPIRVTPPTRIAVTGAPKITRRRKIAVPKSKRIPKVRAEKQAVIKPISVSADHGGGMQRAKRTRRLVAQRAVRIRRSQVA